MVGWHEAAAGPTTFTLPLNELGTPINATAARLSRFLTEDPSQDLSDGASTGVTSTARSASAAGQNRCAQPLEEMRATAHAALLSGRSREARRRHSTAHGQQPKRRLLRGRASTEDNQRESKRSRRDSACREWVEAGGHPFLVALSRRLLGGTRRVEQRGQRSQADTLAVEPADSEGGGGGGGGRRASGCGGGFGAFPRLPVIGAARATVLNLS